VAGSIARSLHVETILRELADQLHTQLGYPAVHIYRHEGQDLILAHYSGPQPVVERLSSARGISGRVARSGKASFVRDVRTDPEYVAGLVGTVSEIAVPIRLNDEVIGVLNVETSDPEQFESGTLELLEIRAAPWRCRTRPCSNRQGPDPGGAVASGRPCSRGGRASAQPR
jgi:putative methionine-R-sulfoxide reductase with GAF domain